MVCKGLCQRQEYRYVGWGPKGPFHRHRDGRYSLDRRYCKTCGKFIQLPEGYAKEGEKVLCPCCNYLMRMHPRPNGKFKEKDTRKRVA